MFSVCLCDVAALKINDLLRGLEIFQGNTQLTSCALLPPVFVMSYIQKTKTTEGKL